MQFTCLTENLVKGLSTVSKAIPLKHSLPILTNVLITAQDGRVRLSGTNLDTVITLYLGSSVDADGAITVPAKLLHEYVSNITAEQVTLNLDNSPQLNVNAGKTKSKFNVVSAEDYPPLPDFESTSGVIEVDPKDFSNAVSQVSFSVALDESRPVFSGIYMIYRDGKLVLVGSDGFRLSEKVIAAEGNVDALESILPAKTLVEISRIFSSCDEKIKIFLNGDENLCVFECEETVVASRLIEGSYPDYTAIIPKEFSVSAKLSGEALTEAAKLTNVFAKTSNNLLKMIFRPDGILELSSNDQELGDSVHEVEVSVEGLEEPFEVLFNARYLLDFLNNNKVELLSFGATDPKSPCLIKGEGDETYLHIMAPMHPTS